jgi:hypothetical protein
MQYMQAMFEAKQHGEQAMREAKQHGGITVSNRMLTHSVVLFPLDPFAFRQQGVHVCELSPLSHLNARAELHPVEHPAYIFASLSIGSPLLQAHLVPRECRQQIEELCLR